MSNLLLTLAKRQFNSDITEQFQTSHIEQLINYGFLKHHSTFSKAEKLKHKLNFLNENRKSKVIYKNEIYLITSFIFMAFYIKSPGDYIREKVILPYWFKKFSSCVFTSITKNLTPEDCEGFSSRIQKRLNKLGLVVKKSEVIKLEQFFSRECILSQDLIDALPVSYKTNLPILHEDDHAYLTNPNIFIRAQFNNIPEAIKSSIHNCKWVQDCKPSIWVINPITEVTSMYWLDDKQLSLLKSLLEERITVNNLTQDVKQLFSYIYVIYTPMQIEKERRKLQNQIAKAVADLEDKQLFTLQTFLLPVDYIILRKYIHYILANKYLIADKANGKTSERYWIHRDDFTFYIHYQVNSLINKILPEPVKPGHNALTVYKPGATLPKHSDDVLAFSWVMSLAVEMNPCQELDAVWPIYVEVSNKKHQIRLGEGDGVLINPQMPHWRDKLENHALNILFLWFIPITFQGYVNGNWID